MCRITSSEVNTKSVNEESKIYGDDIEKKYDVTLEQATKGRNPQNNYDKTVGSGAPNKIYTSPYMDTSTTDEALSQ